MSTSSVTSVTAGTLAAASSSFALSSSGSCPKFNCSIAPELKSNPDISGIGVLLGFAISAYLTLFSCAAYYYINLDGTSDPVDRLFLEKFSPESTKSVAKKWSEALQSAVLALGDTQVVTGVSILVSGYIQLACGLQYYHWRIMVDLAFFSSITHLTTLTCLRTYLQKRSAIRMWRLICMGVTAVFLAVALGSKGYYDAGLEWPAQCLLTHNFGIPVSTSEVSFSGTYRYDSLYTAIVLCFLSFSYLSRVVQLFASAQMFIRKYFRLLPSNRTRGWLDSVRDRATASSTKRTRATWLLVHRLLISLYFFSKAVADVYGSMLWEITWLALALIWGTIAVWSDRGGRNLQSGVLSRKDQVTLSEDNTWGFGQVFPLILLVLPLVSFFEVICGIVFPTEDTSPISPRKPNMASLVPAPGRSLNSANSTISRLPDQSDTTSLISRNTEYEYDFYQYPWFTRLIFLIYGLNLGLAGNVLWFLPYKGLSSDIERRIWAILFLYFPWIAYNFGIVWIYILVFLHLSTTPVPGKSSSVGIDLDDTPPDRSRWTSPATCNVVVLALLGSSVAVGTLLFYMWLKFI